MNLALAIVALGGCGADLPPIGLVKLEPGWVYNGEVSVITVEGENFYPSVTASSFAEPEVESDFRAWVGTDPPTEVDVLPTSLTTLEVRIPEGLPVREDEPFYDFTVESSDGTRDTLEGALEVTDEPAYALSAELDDNVAVVGEWVTVHLAILNRSGDVELGESLEVNVQADPDVLEFSAGRLDHQVWLGNGVQGILDAQHDDVIVRSNVTELVELTITPTDPNSDVASDHVTIDFGPGDITTIAVTVVNPAAIHAGDPTQVEVKLLDENNQVVDDEARSITIRELCDGTNSRQDDMLGPTTFVFPLHRATGAEPCLVNRIVVDAEGVTGQSEPLTVEPGPAAQLRLITSSWMTAGERTGDVWVWMQDEFGNDVDTYETTAPDLDLEQHVAEPVEGPPPMVAWQHCTAFEDGRADCTVEVLLADANVTITARDGNGLVGESAPFEVVAGAPYDIQVVPQLPVVQAGAELEVRIYVTDRPGNVIHIEPTGGDVLHFTDETGAPLDCAYDGVDSAIPYYEVHVFDCVFTQVGTKRVVVDLDSLGLSDFASSDIAVQNGELARVSIDLGGLTTVGAGVTFEADLVGTDAWGNPYVVQSNPWVDVRDGTGSLTPFVVELDPSGRASDQSMDVKRATLSDRIVATQDGNVLGSSPVFAVTAGAFEELLVDVDGPVVSVDDPGIVLVSAVDQYGNAVSSFDDAVDLSSTSGLGNPVVITSWVDGRAAVEFPFDTLGAQDTLKADDGVNEAWSAPFDVVDFGCAAGPTANLEVGSGLPLRLCLLPGMGATSFDLSSSAAGAELIEIYYYERGDGSVYRTGASGWSTTWTLPGGYAVSGIVVDRDLCASASSGWVYVGYPDGQPVGPVDVSIVGGATSVHAETGWVTVDVSAWTCSGDPAIEGALLASVDSGTLVVAGSNRSTGSGIELALDASATGSIVWTMSDQPAGGLATFVAGVRSGAAHGEVTLDVEGDSSHPTVLEVSPVGTHPDAFDSMAILFSDPMQATSISSTSVVLLDPTGTVIALDELALASSGPNEGRELLLRFEEQTGAAGVYTLRLTSDVRKAPGPYDNANTLDGNYLGGSEDFVVSFGGVTNVAPDVLTCDPSTPLFRPDGDHSGHDPFEADVVELDLVANGPAAWWLLEVFDLIGNQVDVSHVAADDLDVGIIEWDGRSSDGTILDNGMYVVAVTAKDASWNEGAPCLANVTIDNVLVPVDE